MGNSPWPGNTALSFVLDLDFACFLSGLPITVGVSLFYGCGTTGECWTDCSCRTILYMVHSCGRCTLVGSALFAGITGFVGSALLAGGTRLAGTPPSLLCCRLSPHHIWPWELLTLPLRRLDRGQKRQQWRTTAYLCVDLGTCSLSWTTPFFSLLAVWATYFNCDFRDVSISEPYQRQNYISYKNVVNMSTSSSQKLWIRKITAKGNYRWSKAAHQCLKVGRWSWLPRQLNVTRSFRSGRQERDIGRC